LESKNVIKDFIPILVTPHSIPTLNLFRKIKKYDIRYYKEGFELAPTIIMQLCDFYVYEKNDMRVFAFGCHFPYIRFLLLVTFHNPVVLKS
jgi:hypothetical protein